MMSLFAGVSRLAFFVVAAALSFAAILAAFGFISPLLDALNHLQPLWFFGTLVCLLLTGVFFRAERSRALMIALSATGFLTSGIIVMPEFFSGFLARPAAEADAPSYRLMTYNIFGRNYDMAGVAAMIRDTDPDIIAFNEYYPEQRGPLHPLLAPDYPHFALCAGGKRANLAIYARLPFETGPGEPCVWDNDRRTGFLAARFTPEGAAPFTVMATQLDWPVQVSPLFDTDIGDLPARLDRVTARQFGQYVHLSSGLETLDGPLLLAGDLNATSWSYMLRHFARDNGLTRETRNLATFPALWHFDTWREVPAFLPIDHVLSRGGISVNCIGTAPAAGSDHLPVVADFTVSTD